MFTESSIIHFPSTDISSTSTTIAGSVFCLISLTHFWIVSSEVSTPIKSPLSATPIITFPPFVLEKATSEIITDFENVVFNSTRSFSPIRIISFSSVMVIK